MSPVYSHSRISSFENCPLQYKYRYIDRIPKSQEGIEAFVGKLVHEVLEALYSDLPAARAKDAAWWRAQFTSLWERKWSPEVRIVRETMTADDYRQLGERCVERFVATHHPFEGGEVIACEEKVEFALDPGGRYRMLGFIDRIDRVGPGSLEIHDYKTGSLPRGGALRNDRQLTLYEIALRQRWPDTVEVRHVWHYLAHEKQFVEQRDRDGLKRVRLETIEAIRRIESTTKFHPKRTALCGWCDYQSICPEWEAERLSGLVAMPRPAEPIAPAGLRVTEPPPAAERPPGIEGRTGQYLLFGGKPNP